MRSWPAGWRGAEAGAAEASAAGGEHIVLGLRNFGLGETAGKVRGTHLLDNPDWMNALGDAIRNPNTRVTVSLEGFEGSSTYSQVMGAVQRWMGPAARYTEWEVAQLYQAGKWVQ